MKTIFLILAMSCFLCPAQETKSNRPDTRIEKLKQAFDQKDYNTFFKYFPGTYKELVDFYKDKSLHGLSDSHVYYLFHEYQGRISPEVFAKKVYGAAKGGNWYDDEEVVMHFQSSLKSLILLMDDPDMPKIFIEILNTKSNKEATAFWHFLFDGSSRYDRGTSNQFDIIYCKINLLDKRQGKLLKEEFEKMYKDDDTCG